MRESPATSVRTMHRWMINNPTFSELFCWSATSVTTPWTTRSAVKRSSLECLGPRSMPQNSRIDVLFHLDACATLLEMLLARHKCPLWPLLATAHEGCAIVGDKPFMLPCTAHLYSSVQHQRACEIEPSGAGRTHHIERRTSWLQLTSRRGSDHASRKG